MQLAVGVLEIANQLLFPGIDRDRRLTGSAETHHLIVEALELRVAVGMLGSNRASDLRPQPPTGDWLLG